MNLRTVWQLLDSKGCLVYQDLIYTKVLAYAKRKRLKGYEIAKAVEDLDANE